MSTAERELATRLALKVYDKTHRILLLECTGKVVSFDQQRACVSAPHLLLFEQCEDVNLDTVYCLVSLKQCKNIQFEEGAICLEVWTATHSQSDRMEWVWAVIVLAICLISYASQEHSQA